MPVIASLHCHPAEHLLTLQLCFLITVGGVGAHSAHDCSPLPGAGHGAAVELGLVLHQN